MRGIKKITLTLLLFVAANGTPVQAERSIVDYLDIALCAWTGAVVLRSALPDAQQDKLSLRNVNIPIQSKEGLRTGITWLNLGTGLFLFCAATIGDHRRKNPSSPVLAAAICAWSGAVVLRSVLPDAWQDKLSLRNVNTASKKALRTGITCLNLGTGLVLFCGALLSITPDPPR